MARYEGMALALWNVLAGGKFRTDTEEDKRRETGEKGRIAHGGHSATWERNESEKKVSYALEKVAKEVGAKHINAGIVILFRHLTNCLWIAASS